MSGSWCLNSSKTSWSCLSCTISRGQWYDRARIGPLGPPEPRDRRTARVHRLTEMDNEPRRRRSRGRRRPASPPVDRTRPTRPPAVPKPPPARGLVRRERTRRRVARGPEDIRPGTRCVIVLDCREGEPDRTGAAALFEGFFDLETGEPRRSGFGVPRLRIVAGQGRPSAVLPGLASPTPPDPRMSNARPAPAEPPSTERLWGFECWWRPDPTGAGLTDTDRVELEQSKKLLRGLIRDSRRSSRPLASR